jgi:hypothetical protein
LAHKLSIGLLWFPGPRATAYINILKELDIAINVIVVMKNDKGNIKGLTQEAATNNYSAQYFDVDYSLQQYVEEFGVRIVATSATHINDLTLSEIIFTEHVQDWIFCGGGILKPHLFSKGKRYIHVHPGKLPNFRGSTCFYYSILHDLSLASSAFYMSQKLDDGDNLAITEFNFNLRITEHMPLFFDYILDPWIRALSLKKVLLDMLSENLKVVNGEPPESNRTYYVMHPILRNLTLKKLNEHYDPKKIEGIFECK